ncbi:polysaccharide biosynthesis protein [Chloroflexota bacterium]
MLKEFRRVLPHLTWSLLRIHDSRMRALCGIEVIIVAAAAIIAFFLRFPTATVGQYLSEFWWIVPLAIFVRIVIFWLFGLYSWVWYYMGIREVLYLTWAVSAGSVVLGGIGLAVSGFTLSKILLIMDWLLVMVLVGGERLFFRLWREYQVKQAFPLSQEPHKRLLIIGAGDAAEMITREINDRLSSGYHLVGYADDDLRKVGQSVHGVPVLGTTQDIPQMVSQHNIDEILVAVPSASGESMRRIVAKCQESQAKFRTIPAIHELIDGKVTINKIREIEIEDLLRREPYQPDLMQRASYLNGSRVLVTGAAGSIGSELCRQIAKFEPDSLILFDFNENDLYELEFEMRRQFPDLRMEAVIGDIRSKSKAELMMKLYHPDIIFHAAAHKHVPLMEKNSDEAVLNNILGTKVWIEAADQYSVKRFVFVSTDKAVNPTSVMGATKRVAGMMVLCKSKESQTKFVLVRFGNVMGSKGSVIPLFRKQIAQGGPITVTHPEIVRYFMTIGEAAQLIIQAAALGNGGEVFVLDMGQPVKILDLAHDMLKLSGLKEGEDIEIKFIGLRPGEKPFEEMFTKVEGITSTQYEKIFLSKLEDVDNEKLVQGIAELEKLALHRDCQDIKRKLKELVPSYQPEGME